MLIPYWHFLRILLQKSIRHLQGQKLYFSLIIENASDYS
jgi:hypothetical protein